MTNYKTTIKRDGTVRVWNVYEQAWTVTDVESAWRSDELMGSVGSTDARRISLAYARELVQRGYEPAKARIMAEI